MIYARFLLETKPNAKIGVLHENDDLGRDYLRGLKQGSGDKASTMIVAEKSHEITDPTIDSAVISIEAAGADTFLQFTNQRYAAQGIRKERQLQTGNRSGSSARTLRASDKRWSARVSRTARASFPLAGRRHQTIQPSPTTRASRNSRDS